MRAEYTAGVYRLWTLGETTDSPEVSRFEPLSEASAPLVYLRSRITGKPVVATGDRVRLSAYRGCWGLKLPDGAADAPRHEMKRPEMPASAADLTTPIRRAPAFLLGARGGSLSPQALSHRLYPYCRGYLSVSTCHVKPAAPLISTSLTPH